MSVTPQEEPGARFVNSRLIAAELEEQDRNSPRQERWFREVMFWTLLVLSLVLGWSIVSLLVLP